MTGLGIIQLTDLFGPRSMTSGARAYGPRSSPSVVHTPFSPPGSSGI